MKTIEIKAPIQSLISEINVEIDQKIEVDDILLIFEVMKTRNEILAETTGVVKQILVSVDDLVDTDQVLMTIEVDD